MPLGTTHRDTRKAASIPRMRSPLLAATLTAIATLSACASPCTRVKEAYAELADATQAGAPGDHLRLSIPLELANLVVNREVRQLPRAPVPLPAIAGVSLGTASVGVDRVLIVPGEADEVSFAADVSVRSGKRSLLPIRIDARVRPRLDPESGAVIVALDQEGLVSMDATLGPGGARALVDALWAQLPTVARTMTSKDDLTRLAEPAATQLLRRAADIVERDMLDELGAIARIELELPAIAVDEIHVRSTTDDLIVGVHTPLPAKGAVAPTLPRATPKHQVELAMHGAVATALVNDAMKRGQVPDRFDLDGAADPNGALKAQLAWDAAGPKPLLVHAFLLDPTKAGRPAKDCAHITLGATPRVTADRGRLILATDDAKVQAVEGSTAVKAGLFFGGVSRRSFEHVEHIAVDTEFELGAQQLRAQLQNAQLTGDTVVFGLTLASEPPARPARR